MIFFFHQSAKEGKSSKIQGSIQVGVFPIAPGVSSMIVLGIHKFFSTILFRCFCFRNTFCFSFDLVLFGRYLFRLWSGDEKLRFVPSVIWDGGKNRFYLFSNVFLLDNILGCHFWLSVNFRISSVHCRIALNTYFPS